ncbi:COQ9 family protein [Aestuariispira insulae]|uniref:Ubiquinone biosynthesis protein COQ9 n=1 Tax=Aestuariispira insulae TaxID=1461337 RepID=A0A3D9HXA9_9PROT|nr:COQ9 family protein [Aestuariispira insulae]RED54143.1 ubiquinone biosynthesis protein COQ9 [Aestuariispira insulae]
MATKTDRQVDEIAALRDRLIDAAVEHVPFDGWGREALALAADDIGIDLDTASRHFPGGARDMISWHSQMADRRMLAALEAGGLKEMKIRDRIKCAVKTRLDQNQEQKEAIRKALSFLSMPGNTVLATKLLYRTVDDMWFAAGDTSTDWNFYTKRSLLSGVYSSTLLYWLADHSEDHKDTWAFLDRRIENVMQVPKLTGAVSKVACWLPRRFGAVKAFRAGARSEMRGRGRFA